MSPDWEEMAVVGRIARAHGNRGEVIVNPETDFAEERFRTGAALYISRGGRIEAVRVTAARFHRGRPILKLDGVDTITEAERLANLELRVPADTLQKLPSGVFYRHDLVGCRVRTVRGETLGTVSGVEGTADRSHLVVQGQRGELLIPLAADICVAIDTAGGTVTVDPPEGLLELNE